MSNELSIHRTGEQLHISRPGVTCVARLTDCVLLFEPNARTDIAYFIQVFLQIGSAIRFGPLFGPEIAALQAAGVPSYQGNVSPSPAKEVTTAPASSGKKKRLH